jgi:hypothetical protein
VVHHIESDLALQQSDYSFLFLHHGCESCPAQAVQKHDYMNMRLSKVRHLPFWVILLCKNLRIVVSGATERKELKGIQGRAPMTSPHQQRSDKYACPSFTTLAVCHHHISRMLRSVGGDLRTNDASQKTRTTFGC